MPADGDLLDRFSAVQRAALMSALGWSPGQADRRVKDLAGEAADYLRGSSERGDVSVAGKVEQHLPDAIDLGVIWTHSDRSFIVLRND
jgi:hypothetical protein